MAAEGALSRLTILEKADMVAGPYCTKLLAELGAEVIKRKNMHGIFTFRTSRPKRRRRNYF